MYKEQIRDDLKRRIAMYDTHPQFSNLADTPIGGTYRDIGMHQTQRQKILACIRAHDQWYNETETRHKFRERLLEFLDAPTSAYSAPFQRTRPKKTYRSWSRSKSPYEVFMDKRTAQLQKTGLSYAQAHRRAASDWSTSPENPAYKRREAKYSRSQGGAAATPPQQQTAGDFEPLFSDVPARKRQSPPPSRLSRSLARGLSAFSAVRSPALFESFREWYNPQSSGFYFGSLYRPVQPQVEMMMTDANLRNFFREQHSYQSLIPSEFSFLDRNPTILLRTLNILKTPPFDAYPHVDRFRLVLARQLRQMPSEWFAAYGSHIQNPSKALALEYFDWLADYHRSHPWTREAIASIYYLPFRELGHGFKDLPESLWSDLREFLVRDPCDHLEFLIYFLFHKREIPIDEMIMAFHGCHDETRCLDCQKEVEIVISNQLKKRAGFIITGNCGCEHSVNSDGSRTKSNSTPFFGRVSISMANSVHFSMSSRCLTVYHHRMILCIRSSMRIYRSPCPEHGCLIQNGAWTIGVYCRRGNLDFQVAAG